MSKTNYKNNVIEQLVTWPSSNTYTYTFPSVSTSSCNLVASTAKLCYEYCIISEATFTDNTTDINNISFSFFAADWQSSYEDSAGNTVNWTTGTNINYLCFDGTAAGSNILKNLFDCIDRCAKVVQNPSNTKTFSCVGSNAVHSISLIKNTSDDIYSCNFETDKINTTYSFPSFIKITNTVLKEDANKIFHIYVRRLA